jgi:hypothetical protein
VSPKRGSTVFRAPNLRRFIAFGVAGACAAAFAITAATPAGAATTQTASCVDGGGVRWSAKAIWGGTYSSGGVRKVAIDYAGWTTNRAGALPTDSWVRSYDGTGKRLKTLTWTGAFDYASGTAYKSRDPRNPTSAPGAAKVTVTLGVDGDGFGNCTMSFIQPGATAPPESSPSPTSTPTSTAPSQSPTSTPTSTAPSQSPTSTPTSTAPSQSPTSTPTSTAPSQACAGFPDAACTGVPAGQTLTIVTGDQSFGSSFNGRTISNMDFRGWVRVSGANITFKNSIFRGRVANGANHALIDTEDSTGTITIIDSEFVPSAPSATIDGLWTRNTNIYRADIRGGVDGMKANSNTLVQDSYIHDMRYFASDPNQGGGPTHNDGVQTFAGESHVTLRHNTIDISDTFDGNAAWQGSGTYSTAENNYLDGGGCTINFDAKSLGGPTLTPMYVNNNHFGRNQASAGCVALISNKTVMTEYNGNVWHDTGQPVPRWQQHD